MKNATQTIFGISKQRGIWLRCFLSAVVLTALISLPSSQFARSQGIVDCVYPGHVAVSRVEGKVFGPFGVVVPGVVVSLVNEQGSTLQTKTDSEGRFRVAASPGKYSFKAVFPMFQTSQTELNVGEDLVGLVHPGNLWVILGLNGADCAWVTTSQKEFRQIISSNKKRAEESAQRNATQK
jgi:hypothetical protein